MPILEAAPVLARVVALEVGDPVLPEPIEGLLVPVATTLVARVEPAVTITTLLLLLEVAVPEASVPEVIVLESVALATSVLADDPDEVTLADALAGSSDDDDETDDELAALDVAEDDAEVAREPLVPLSDG